MMIAACLFGACKSRTAITEDNLNTISVTVNNPEKLFYSEMFDSLKYIALETSDDILISDISKMRYVNNRFFIFDKRTQTVFLFDSAGKAIRKIHSVGLGPKEYFQLMDFDVDETTGRIFLFSFMDKIQVYDFDGNFIEEYRIMLRGTGIAAKGEVMYLHTNRMANAGKYHLVILNKNGVLRGEIPFEKELHKSINYNSHEAFCKYGDELLFFMPFSRDIYAIGGDSTYIKHRFDFGEYNLPDNYLNNYTLDDMDETKYAYGLNSYWENRKYIYFRIRINQDEYAIIHSKKDGKIYNTLRDDMAYYGPVISQVTDDYAVGFMPADALFWGKRNAKNEPDNTISDKITSEITEDDNPVVFLYYFKK
jgi:hypothetical protein